MVGYAVAEQGVDGLPHCRLVTSWHDLATPHLDPSGSLSEPELEPLRQRLRDVARQEFAMVQAVPWIEALNERAGRSQLLLDGCGVPDGQCLKRRRAELSTAEVLARLRREIERWESR